MEAYKKNPFYTKFNAFGVKTQITTKYGKMIPKNFRPDLWNNTLIRHILFRRHINMNTFVAVVGDVRSGKSYFSLRLAEQLSLEAKKKFDVKKQCSFEILPFLEWSRSATDSVYVLDEIQVSMSPREWYDTQHKIFNEFCDIQGFRRNVLIMPFPNISFIDKHLRFLINYIVRTLNQGLVKWYNVKTQPELGKNWLDFIGMYDYAIPSKETLDHYEAMKKKFCDDELDDYITTLKNRDKPSEVEIQKQEYRKLRMKKLKSEIEWKEQRIKTMRNKPVPAWK